MDRRSVGSDAADTVGIIATPTFLRNLRTERLELPFEEQFQRVLDGGSDWGILRAGAGRGPHHGH